MTTNEETGTTLEHRVGPRGSFTLRQVSGEIAIRGVEGDTVRVRSLDGRSLTDVFDIEVGDGAVALRQQDRLGIGPGTFGRNRGAELAIEVPHGATVSVDTQSADVQASDLSGAKKFRSASGEVTLTRLAGALDVETVSGEIEIEGQAPLDLTARSVSGDVAVRVPTLRRLDLGTTSGDIRLDAELVGNGSFAIRSISGDATIVGRAGFRVEAESITGDLSSDLPSKRESIPGRKVLIVGRPGPTLAFRSVSGDFHVAQPRDAAPAAASATTTGDDGGAPRDATNRDATNRAATNRDATNRAATNRAATNRDATNRDATNPDAALPDAEAARLKVLRELERGDISVAQATDRLNQLDEVLR